MPNAAYWVAYDLNAGGSGYEGYAGRKSNVGSATEAEIPPAEEIIVGARSTCYTAKLIRVEAESVEGAIKAVRNIFGGSGGVALGATKANVEIKSI